MSPESPQAAQVLDVFTAEECAHIAHCVNALAPHWIERKPGALHTLGTAAYLDVPDAKTSEHFAMPIDPALYYRRTAELNPLLREHFGRVHERLADSLAAHLGAPCRYTTRCALPGFHIFSAAPEWSAQAAHVPHFDRQFAGLDWRASGEIDFHRSISFTLAVKLPVEGGGLKTWEVDYYALMAMPIEQRKDFIRAQPRTLHTYRVGGWVCHSGNALHQIAPWQCHPGDQRITLQGHGLFYDGAWNLYW
jgi:hypothetical protein